MPTLFLVVSPRVLSWVHFFILIGDINSGISSSSIMRFADDTRLYHGISNVDASTILQHYIFCMFLFESMRELILKNI